METPGDDLVDGSIRGRFTGLTVELTARLVRQLASNRELKGERCPGEGPCAQTGVLFKYSKSGRTIDQICGGCNLRHTKPDASPLNAAQNTALEIEELQQIGATFAYPDALTPYQWACRKALHRARQEDEAIQTKKRDAEEKRKQ